MPLDKKDIREVVKQFSTRPIAYHTIFTSITGRITGGLLLSQIVYWSSTMKGKEFYKTDESFAEELGMTVYELRSAKSLLQDLKLIQFTRKGLPAKTHYKLNEDNLIASITKVIEMTTNKSKGKSKTRLRESLKQDLGMTLNKIKNITNTSVINDLTKTKNITNTKIKNITNTSLSDDPKLIHRLNTKNTIEEEREKEDTTSSTPVENLLDTITKKKRDSIYLIFEFWNSYKCPRKWQTHTKLSYDMVLAIQENLKSYTPEDICGAINNYAKVLQSNKYFWSYIWSLSSFLMVKEGKYKDAPKKWWQFLPENFVSKNYLGEKEVKEEDIYPELTKEIVKAYAWLINNEKYTPTTSEMVKFVKASKKMTEFFKDRSIIKENWVKYLKNCVKERYTEKGDTLYPGHLCGDHTWSVLLPQYLQELGI